MFNTTINTYRFGNWVHRKVKLPLIRHFLLLIYRVLDLILCRMVAHAEIPRQTPIGKNLRLPHNGNGVIVVRESTIGNNVVIRPQVIIGRTIKDGINAPKIGNNVDIGVGVKILGDVTIGDNVKIGANAVVVKDIPANCTAIGIPATVIKK